MNIKPDSFSLIGIDIGVKYTGICNRHLGSSIDNIQTLESEVVEASLRSHQALHNIINYIEKIRQEKCKPKDRILLIVEDYGFGSGYFNVVQAETIGGLKEYILATDFVEGFIPVNLKTVKKYITGDGNATKAKVKKFIKLLDYSCDSSHTADAVALLLTYLSLSCEPSEAMKRNSLIKSEIRYGNNR